VYFDPREFLPWFKLAFHNRRRMVMMMMMPTARMPLKLQQLPPNLP
jgi:hypothetical protein